MYIYVLHAATAVLLLFAGHVAVGQLQLTLWVKGALTCMVKYSNHLQ